MRCATFLILFVLLNLTCIRSDVDSLRHYRSDREYRYKLHFAACKINQVDWRCQADRINKMRIVASFLLFISFAVLIDAASKLPSVTDKCGKYISGEFPVLIQVNFKLTHIFLLCVSRIISKTLVTDTRKTGQHFARLC